MTLIDKSVAQVEETDSYSATVQKALESSSV